jgi:F0F1-type ATP synthase membrane subunit b/b'
MKQFNEKANAIFSKLRDEGLAEEQRILTEAREAAAKVLEQTRKTVSHELSQAREELKTQIPLLSNKMASRILGRELA